MSTVAVGSQENGYLIADTFHEQQLMNDIVTKSEGNLEELSWTLLRISNNLLIILNFSRVSKFKKKYKKIKNQKFQKNFCSKGKF